MTLRSAADVAARMQQVERAVSDQAMKQRMTQVGVALKPLATTAAAPDLGGDARFSGWAKIGALEAKFSHAGDSAIVMHRTRKSAGGWTVATLGRHQGDATGFVGPRVGARRRKGRRWNGRTQGKGTWFKAEEAMKKKAPPLLAKLNRDAVLKAFTGGR